MPGRMRRDLSKQNNNSTRALEDNYGYLMSISDPDELRDAAKKILDPLVGSGLSDMNHKKFFRNLEHSLRKGLSAAQTFISNYILKGSGMGVEENYIESLNSLVIEGTLNITNEQLRLKTLIENNTNFVVKIF